MIAADRPSLRRGVMSFFNRLTLMRERIEKLKKGREAVCFPQTFGNALNASDGDFNRVAVIDQEHWWRKRITFLTIAVRHRGYREGVVSAS